MKGLARLLTVFSLLLGCWGWLGTTQIAQAASFNSFAFPQVPILAIERQNRADAKLGTEFGRAAESGRCEARNGIW